MLVCFNACVPHTDQLHRMHIHVEMPITKWILVSIVLLVLGKMRWEDVPCIPGPSLQYMLLWYLCNANEVKNLQHMTTQQPHVGKLLALAIKFLTSIHHCNLVRNPSMTFFIATSIARFWSAPVRIVWGAAPPIILMNSEKTNSNVSTFSSRTSTPASIML